MTSFVALLIATPLASRSGSISASSPRAASVGSIGSLVEMLAAIPSVVLGLWGILVLGPFMQDHVEPWLQATLGFIPLFGEPDQPTA